MSDNLINLMNKRISDTEKKLEELKQSRDTLIKSTKSNGLKQMRFEICKTLDGWNLTFPSGIQNNDLPSLDVCLLIIKPFYQKCQFRNQAFELYDHNINSTFTDYRVFTEWVELSKEEKKQKKEEERDPKSVAKKMEKKIKNNRMPRNNKVQSKVKKIDQRIFDRNY